MSWSDEDGMRALAIGYSKRLEFRNALELESAERRLNAWFKTKEQGFKFRMIKDYPMTMEIGHDWSGYTKEAIRILKEAGLKFTVNPWCAPKFLNLDIIKYGKERGLL